MASESEVCQGKDLSGTADEKGALKISFKSILKCILSQIGEIRWMIEKINTLTKPHNAFHEHWKYLSDLSFISYKYKFLYSVSQ